MARVRNFTMNSIKLKSHTWKFEEIVFPKLSQWEQPSHETEIKEASSEFEMVLLFTFQLFQPDFHYRLCYVMHRPTLILGITCVLINHFTMLCVLDGLIYV